MSDVVLIVVIALGFALTVTAQIAILAGLLRRKQKWRALSGLLMPPLSPYWAHTEGMRIRAWIWIAGALVYVVSFVIAVWRG
ncbi:MAG: hypothetical protein ACOC1F_01430 [Myxococcota bacterium]